MTHIARHILRPSTVSGAVARLALPAALLVGLAFDGAASATARARVQAAASPAGGSPAPQAPAGESAPAPAREAAHVDYGVEIAGVEEADLKDLLTRASQLVALADRPPSTMIGLRRRIESDVERLRKVLRSEGFYAGSVDHEITGAPPSVRVVLRVDPGTLYVLADYEARYRGPGAADPALPRGVEDLGVTLGAAAKASTIVRVQRDLVRKLRDLGYPQARVADRKVVVDHSRETAAVTLQVDTGPFARFGTVAVRGLSDVSLDYVERFFPWSNEERFQQSKVDAARADLMASGLFKSVEIEPAESVGAQGRLPMTVTVAERDHRSIGAGVSYSSTEGLGGEAFWEHRNLFNHGEKLRLSATAAEIEQDLSAGFRKPRYRRRNQDLLLNLSATRRDTDAFTSRTVSAFLGLERTAGEQWRFSAGTAFDYSIEEDAEGERTFAILGAPLVASWDGTDSLLDPTGGGRLRLAVTPSVATLERTVPFLSTEARGSAYLSLDPQDRVVLAGRARLGSIVGTDTDELPASKRFFAGGGGSIRGYDYQSVGPLDQSLDPQGGRSILELGAEVRTRITDDIGLVPFVDGGTVYDSPFPDGGETIRWAAGIGLRYYTAVGPLRFDVAFPINGRENIDDTVEFYISLGQSF